MNQNVLNKYECIDSHKMQDINSTGYLLKHKKSGARVFCISNDDENKVFSIGFRTPPADSTGVAHIVEHTVLCGSEQFPAKDPFVELVKGSLNTFLNAMTYPDKTIYPIASCNDKDFQNLMHVYLDAVFYPNIYHNENIFKQEGWHYHLETPEDELTYNGVVYNEMKGAFSSPDGVLDREVLNSLYPDTAYGNESGGAPEAIPNLTYEQFLAFHKKYYHPSNSYIYLYGDMDMEEKLLWMDEAYLSRFNAITVDSEIALQKPFEKMNEVYRKYSITSEEPEEENAFLAYNISIGDSLDRELYLAFMVLEYALISAPGAPLHKILLEKNIGKDISGSYDNGVYQPYFSFVAKKSDVSRKDEFVNVIRESLTDIVKNGLDENALKAGINYHEFRYREADFGSYPKGLMYGIQAFDSWLFDETQPFMHLEENATFAFLKEKIGTGYYEELIQKYMLDNPHTSLVVLEPEKGLSAKLEQETAEKLAAYKASLSKEEIDTLVRETQELLAYQETEDTPEMLAKIPMLKREDMKRTAAPLINRETTICGTKVLHHNMFTNGIGYLLVSFHANTIPQESLPYLGLLKYVLGYIDTEHYDYGSLFNEINRNSGGISSTYSLYSNVKEPKNYQLQYEFKAKVLYEQLGFAFDMIEEMLFHSKLEDEKRLKEIVSQLKSRMQGGLTSSGHATAVGRATSYFSETAYISEQLNGVDFYHFIEQLEADFDNKKEELMQGLREVIRLIFTRENFLISYTADEEGFGYLDKELGRFKEMLPNEKYEAKTYHFSLEKLNEGFKTSSKVQYVGRAGNFRKEGFAYHGAMRILKVVLNYDYLWTKIRVKGGAYGCMSGFNRVGDMYFVSYRDPHLAETNDIIKGTADYVASFKADEREMTKYIIGTISDVDMPLNPAAKGSRSFTAYMNELTEESIQKERDEILNATAEDIRKIAEPIRAVLSQDCICVVGSEEMVEQNRDLFKEIKNLS